MRAGDSTVRCRSCARPRPWGTATRPHLRSRTWSSPSPTCAPAIEWTPTPRRGSVARSRPSGPTSRSSPRRPRPRRPRPPPPPPRRRAPSTARSTARTRGATTSTTRNTRNEPRRTRRRPSLVAELARRSRGHARAGLAVQPGRGLDHEVVREPERDRARGIEPRHRLGGELHCERAEVVLELHQVAGADDREHGVRPRHRPRDRDLRRARADLVGDRLHLTRDGEVALADVGAGVARPGRRVGPAVLAGEDFTG